MRRIDAQGDTLIEHKLDVAKNYATNTYIKDVDERLTAQLSTVNEKLDRVLERLPRPGR